MRATLALLVSLLGSTPACHAAEWEGTWAPTASACTAAGSAVSLRADRIVAQGRDCSVKVERGKGPDDMLVETCKGGGNFLPAFEMVGVHEGRLVVTTPFGGPQRTFERCPSS